MLAEKATRVQSDLERRFLEDCVTVGLVVEPQYPISGIHCDFAVMGKGIAIELDSSRWHASEQARGIDERRNEIYLRHGWKILRIIGRAVYACNGEHFARAIKDGKWDDFFGVAHLFSCHECDD